MEQITRKDGVIYYGIQPCKNAEEAYEKFREEYHQSLGKRVYQRLNRLGQRVERIHLFGVSGPGDEKLRLYFNGGEGRRIDSRLLGIECGSYVRIFGIWDMPQQTEEEYEHWIDWASCAGSGAFRLGGRNDKAGRTSKMSKKRIRNI